MRQYFIHDGQSEKGPFDLEQLKLETLKNDTPIWYEGLDSWTTVAQVDELKNLLVTRQTPPPLNKPLDENKVVPPPISVPLADNLKKKKSSTFILILTSAFVVVFIIGWLVFQNKNQAETLSQVQQQVVTQQQVLTEQQKAETERQRINEAITAKNMNYRNNWRQYINIGRSTYQFSTLGGIESFPVNVVNNSEYMLDEVVVNINYIKTSGETYKTESITINNIPANSYKNGTAPSSNRGTSISTEIASIVCKKMHFCYPYNNGNREDPFFCK